MAEAAAAKPVTERKFVGIERHGEKIILPEGMSYKEGKEWMDRHEKEEESEIRVHEIVETYPLDGALALAKALARTYGFTDLVPTPTFFGPRPPAMIGVEVAFGKTLQVPWGRIQIPNVEGYIETAFSQKEGRWVFLLTGVIKKKHTEAIAKLAAQTRQIAKEESIYKGKAIRISFSDHSDDENAKFSFEDDAPKFIDTSTVREEELIFSKRTMEQLRTNLFTPIDHTEECRQFKVPLKRGILLEGPYGTGKTLTAYVAAKKCENNGWTFIYLGDVSKLEQAIQFGKQYQPSMIFAEDIDQVLEGERDEDMNNILNTIDGVDTKGAEIITTLTTNHRENINAAMLRPGRLDAIVSVTAPDAEAVQALIRIYARGLLRDGEDLQEVGAKLGGQIPAVIREVVERAKLAAISRKQQGESLDLRKQDLLIASDTMIEHAKLLAVVPEDERSEKVKAADALGAHLSAAITQAAHALGGFDPKTAKNGNGKKDNKELSAASV
jgi:transitional endoplasmic reticulum ATPase